MSALSDWNRFSTLDPARLRAVRDGALSRYVRDELWPFAQSARRRLERAGLNPKAIRGLSDLASVAPITAAEIARAQHEPDERAEHQLVPDPDALRSSAGLSRRLALRIGGPRVTKLLAHAYATLFETDGPDGLRLSWTPHDIQIAGESGARCLAILGLQKKRDRTLVLGCPAHETAALALHHGAIQAGARVELIGSESDIAERIERLRPTALVGSIDDLRRALTSTSTGLDQLEHCVLLGLQDSAAERAALLDEARSHTRTDHEVELARLWAPAWARMIFAGHVDPAQPEACVHVHPDLGAFELTEATDGPNLVYTAAGGHGTALLRFATGLRAESVDRTPAGDTVGFPLLAFASAASQL